MKNFSIEYSHIYLDEKFSFNHIQSIKLANSLKSKFKIDAFSFNTCVLIDDYNADENILTIESFEHNLKVYDGVPDIMMFESDLIPYAFQSLEMMKKNGTKKGYENYIKNKERIPCSLFIITWYLVRLGVIKYNEIKIEPATKLITVLPNVFAPAEEKAQKGFDAILGRGAYRDKVELVLFDGIHKSKNRRLD